MAGRVHAHVGKAPHGTEEASRLGGKVHSQFHSDQEKDTTGLNGNTHQYSGEMLYRRHSHGYQHGQQQHGQHIHHYDEEVHPHGCSCTKCTYTSEAYCPPIIDLPKEYETKVKIVQRYPEMRTVEKSFWVKEVQREDRVFMVPKTEIVGYEKNPRSERVPYLKEVTKMRIEIHYEVVKKEIEYTVMVPCIEYEKKVIIDKIPRVHKEIYEEIREVPVLDTEQVTKCSVEWTGKYIEEPIPVEEYCTPGDFNILCKDGRHHGDHHKSKRRSSRSSSVASFDEDRYHHHHVVETVAPNGALNVDSTPKEVHTPTKDKTPKPEEPTKAAPYPPIKVTEEVKELPKHPVTVPASNPTTTTTTTKDGQHLQIPSNPSSAPSMPIKEREGPRNRSGNMRPDIDDEFPAINDPFSLVHDRPSPPDAKVTVTKTKVDHEAGEHAKPVVPIPATAKTKDPQHTKIAGTPSISKPKEIQHHDDHQHVKLTTAGAIKPTDQQREDHQIAIKAPTQAIKPKDQPEEQHPIKIPTQAGKPKEKVAAPPAITTPASSNSTKDQHEELKQHQQHPKGHLVTTPAAAAAATKSILKEHEDHHEEPLKNVHSPIKTKAHEDSEPSLKKVQTSSTTVHHEAAAAAPDLESPTQIGKKKPGLLSKFIKN